MVDVTKKRQIFIPITKTSEGYRGILSSDSVDRDDETISKNLLYKWSKSEQFLPILADHDNTIDNYLGGWTSKRYVEKDGIAALEVEPTFFTSKANPKAQRVKAMMDELQVGLSIGAIPHSSRDVKIDGKTFNEWVDAELLEGSVTPVQSNRHSFAMLAKKFNISYNSDLQKRDQPKEDVTMVDKKNADGTDVKLKDVKPINKDADTPPADKPADGGNGDAPAEPDKKPEPTTPPAEPDKPAEGDGDGKDKPADPTPDAAPAAVRGGATGEGKSDEKRFTEAEVKKIVAAEVEKHLKGVSVYAARLEDPTANSAPAQKTGLNDIFEERAKRSLGM